MSGSSITLSASVQKDLLLFNDSKTALPVETVEILTQEICLKIVKMPSTDSRMEQLESKAEYLAINLCIFFRIVFNPRECAKPAAALHKSLHIHT